MNHAAATLALRARAIGAVAASTGSISLTATATGYTRNDAGSFLTDNFVGGQELTPVGFASNPVDIITNVTASSITMRTPRSAEGPAVCSLIVGLPSMRAWTNERFTRTTSRYYVEEDYVPATRRLLTTNASTGTVEDTGLYVLRIFGLPTYGILGLSSVVDAVLAQFTPGTIINAGSQAIYIPANPSSQRGQFLPQGDGWTVCPISIPWLVRSNNSIAA